MLDEVDTLRSANLLISQHGTNAAVQAAMRADALLAQGDVEGALIWKRIVAAIEELERQKRRHDEGLH
jgi:hypothetical protein